MPQFRDARSVLARVLIEIRHQRRQPTNDRGDHQPPEEDHEAAEDRLHQILGRRPDVAVAHRRNTYQSEIDRSQIRAHRLCRRGGAGGVVPGAGVVVAQERVASLHEALLHRCAVERDPRHVFPIHSNRGAPREEPGAAGPVARQEHGAVQRHDLLRCLGHAPPRAGDVPQSPHLRRQAEHDQG